MTLPKQREALNMHTTRCSGRADLRAYEWSHFRIRWRSRPGQRVAVFGARPIGCAAIRILKAAGATKIFAVETRAELARITGATHPSTR